MARIVYGVCGEGFGHSSRAHLIGQRLLEAGHDVRFVGSFRSLSYLREHFGERVHEGFGLLFFYHKGRVNPAVTVYRNLRRAAKLVTVNRRLFRDVLDPFRPELVISDFDPTTAWWAWRRGVPLLSIDNEQLLTRCRLDHLPGQALNYFNAQIVTRAHCFAARRYLIISFFRTPTKHPRARLAPPVVRHEVTDREPIAGEHVVLYTTTGYGREALIELLGQFPDQAFHIYNYGEPGRVGNCHFRPRSTDGFLDDLASCRGVIGTAGFSLISECLVLRKRMLLLPIPGQYEQVVNAHYLRKLGWADVAGTLDGTALEAFLAHCQQPLADHPDIIWPNNEAFFEQLNEVLVGFGPGLAIL